MFGDASLSQAIARMREYSRPWAVGGGWSIDLFLGRVTRAHGDVDIATLRVDQAALRSFLRDAVARKAVDGRLVEWRADETLVLPTHEIHAAWPDGSRTEFLLNEGDERVGWVFRRDRRVRLPFDRAFRERDGVPFLAPEVALLYKSNTRSATNDADFANAIEQMDREQLAWFRRALEITAPGHAWLVRE